MKYLVVTVLGSKQPGLAYAIASFIHSSGCSVMDSRWQIMGGEACGQYFLSGNWNGIAKLESQLPSFADKMQLQIQSKRTEIPAPTANQLPYLIYAVAQDRPGILDDLLRFLVEEGVEIIDYQSVLYTGRNTDTRIMSLTMSVTLPSNQLISELRERFIIYCDELNIDATIEPDKNF